VRELFDLGNRSTQTYVGYILRLIVVESLPKLHTLGKTARPSDEPDQQYQVSSTTPFSYRCSAVAIVDCGVTTWTHVSMAPSAARPGHAIGAVNWTVPSISALRPLQLMFEDGPGWYVADGADDGETAYFIKTSSGRGRREQSPWLPTAPTTRSFHVEGEPRSSGTRRTEGQKSSVTRRDLKVDDRQRTVSPFSNNRLSSTAFQYDTKCPITRTGS